MTAVGDPLRRRLHLRHRERIRHGAADRRIEKVLDRVELDAAAGDDPRQHLRQVVTLRDRKRARGIARRQAVTPNTPGRGVRDAEKRRLDQLRQWHGDGHGQPR